MARTKATIKRLPTLVPAPGRELEIKTLQTEETQCLKLRHCYHNQNKSKSKKWPSFKENESQKKIPLFL